MALLFTEGRPVASLHWRHAKDGDRALREIYNRHYSSRRYADGRNPALFVGPGEKLVLTTDQHDALFVWRKFIDGSGQTGVNCAVFRNEGRVLSSQLILEAEDVARTRWPAERFYTYVNPRSVRSQNAGYCFQCAGWRNCGTTKGGLIIFEKTVEPITETPREWGPR